MIMGDLSVSFGVELVYIICIRIVLGQLFIVLCRNIASKTNRIIIIIIIIIITCSIRCFRQI